MQEFKHRVYSQYPVSRLKGARREVGSGVCGVCREELGGRVGCVEGGGDGTSSGGGLTHVRESLIFVTHYLPACNG